MEYKIVKPRTQKSDLPGEIQDFVGSFRRTLSSDGGTRHVIPLPIKFAWVTVSVKPIGGSATVYTTISSSDEVVRGDGVLHLWEHGTITTPAFFAYENPWVALVVECQDRVRIEVATKYD